MPSSTRPACKVTQGQRLLRQPRQRGVDRDHMDMRVDQPRHQRAAGEIDRRASPLADRPVGDFLDAIVLDEDVMFLAPLAARAVEDRAIGKDDRGHRAFTVN